MTKISKKYRSKQITPEFMEQAAKGGVKFEMYLIPDLAEWIMKLVENGIYAGPDDAVFHMLLEFQNFEKYHDLREEVINRNIQESIKEMDEHPENSITVEELMAKLENLDSERFEPATWEKDPSVYDSYLEEDGFEEDDLNA